MTGSELMIDTLTKFSDAEATSVLIVWTDANGDISVTSNCSMSSVMGMAEYAKLATFATMRPVK